MNEMPTNRASLTSRRTLTSRSRASTTSLSNSHNVKQNQLQWMHNRRKTQLARTSQENIQIYLRLQATKSSLAQTLGRKLHCPPATSRVRTGISEKENAKVENEIKRRETEISKLLAVHELPGGRRNAGLKML